MIIFGIYLLLLVKLIVFKYPIDSITINPGLAFSNGSYVPFRTILGYLGGEPTWRVAIYNLLGNVLLFVPLGIFLPSLWRNITWKGMLAVALGFSVTLEIFQLFFIGTPDVDDVILNSLGAILGYGAFLYFVSMVKKFRVK